MSDFVPRDILPDLWEEILQRHWTFLETEESMQKLEERKKLEGCLKEFLCIVPHDRKFFLPETAHVLKKSIKDMDDFSAYKAMIGFESISQYANNLFTKPWRKEYRVIKMYSGFYQHEIKSNLIDADKLFEAMGYRKLQNQILMLDGPICPDQVTNVSRDAMAAYVECQIMKQIFSGFTSLQLSCSWLDIFNFRETHIGGASQAVKSIAYAVQERRLRKEKLNSETCYATIQHPHQQALSSCPTCAHTCHTQIPQIGNPCGIHHVTQPQNYPGICSIHPQPTQNIYMHNNVPVPMHYKPQGYGPSQMSHSKSLEHYAEHVVPAGALPHRHSFDQPYDATYDCVDGYQSCNFNAHPYNVSGNRYPLPYNISAQLNNQFSGCANAGHYPPPPPPPPTISNCGHKLAMQPDQIYSDCNGYTKKPQDFCNYHSNSRQCAYAASGNKINNMNTDQLIDFDDRPNDIGNAQAVHHNRSHNNSFECIDRITYDQPNRPSKIKQPQYDIPRSHHQNIINPSPKDLYNRNVENIDEIDGNYLYNNGRNEKKITAKRPVDKYVRNAEILEQYEKIIDNNEIKAVHDSYDSFEDILAVDGSDSTPSKSVSNKNQDGVGSFESWDYVFQNLEKHGYTKDLGERGDLLVQGLDLDSMKISGPGEKRRSRNVENKPRAPSENVKSKTLEKTDLTKESSNKVKVTTTEKSILKHDDQSMQKAVIKASQVQKSTQSNQKPKSGKVMNNNYDDSSQSVEKRSSSRSTAIATRATTNGTSTSHHRSISTGPNGGNGRSASTTTNVPTIIASSPNEWSCRFCTYLNPDTRRICEMCCRSRDFVLDATNPTCV